MSLEAERTVLGAALLDPDALTTAAEILKPSHFRLAAHVAVFEAMLEMTARGVAVDLLTVKESLIASKNLDRAGGVANLAALIDGVPRITNVQEWAEIVRDKAIVRQVATAAGRIGALCQDEGVVASAVVESALREVMAVASDSVQGGFRPPVEDVKAGMAAIDRMSQALGGVTGIDTGLADLNAQLGGLHPGELILIGARPSQGKTALGISIGDSAAACGDVVAFFSLEMGRDEIAVRRICAQANIGSHMFRGNPESKAIGRASAAIGKIARFPFFVDDTFSTTVSQMRAKAQRLRMEQGALGLVIVDYIQLVQGDGRSENRNLEVAAISRGLKGMAKDLGIPVIGLSQLNRGAKGRAEKRPTMEDLRDSGALEQDADVVLLLHRAEEYGATDENRGVAEIIVAKQRNGPTGVVLTAFIKEFGRFENLVRKAA